MDTTMIETRVKHTVSEMLGVSQADMKGTDTFEGLGADSIDKIELVMALEEEFECEVPDEDAEKIVNVQGAIDYLKARLGVPSDRRSPQNGEEA